jgi:hypothetical protein
MPPISVYRVGELHFVRDGHHRVSVARALGRTHIDAYATKVTTRVGAQGTIRAADLPLKSHERVFLERVPLTPEQRDRVRLSDAWATRSWPRASRLGGSESPRDGASS